MSLAHLAMPTGIDAGESSALDAEWMRQFRWPGRCRSIDKRLRAELAKKRKRLCPCRESMGVAGAKAFKPFGELGLEVQADRAAGCVRSNPALLRTRR